jgi:GNAT superfamily N-acetyltransferase
VNSAECQDCVCSEPWSVTAPSKTALDQNQRFRRNARLTGMSAESLRSVDGDEQASVYATLVSAFTNDPVERWLWPEPAEYRSCFPQFLAAFGGRAFETDTVWTLEEFSAVAMWLPPGAEPDGASIISVLTDTVAPSLHDDLFAVMDDMEAAHPNGPHWYLPWFGVDASRQGSGLGNALMAACLGAVDSHHLPAYLETPNPRTIGFYERHRFTVTGHSQHGSCPPMTFMQREAG